MAMGPPRGLALSLRASRRAVQKQKKERKKDFAIMTFLY
jgi:hypothetical protein